MDRELAESIKRKRDDDYQYTLASYGQQHSNKKGRFMRPGEMTMMTHHHGHQSYPKVKEYQRTLISNEAMSRIYAFYLENNFAETCLRKKIDCIFKGDWYIAWFNKEKEVLRPELINQPNFKQLIQEFFMEASIMLELFKFFGYYVEKDIVGWYVKSTKRAEAMRKRGHVIDHQKGYYDKLPFGVIPLVHASSFSTNSTSIGDYYTVSEPGSYDEWIEFECRDEARRARYDHKVFQNGDQCIPIVSRKSTHSHRGSFCNSSTVYDIGTMDNVNNMSYGNNVPSREQRAFQLSSPSFCEVMPTSPFINLYKDKKAIKEAEDYESSVGYQSARPTIIATVKPPKESDLGTLPTDMYFSMDNLSSVKQVDSLRKQQTFLRAAIQMQNESRNKETGGANENDNSHNDGPIIVQEQHEKWRHADSIEFIHFLPDTMTVSHCGQPKKVIDPLPKKKELELEISNTLRVPLPCVKPLSSASISSLSSSTTSSKMTGVTNKDQYSIYDDLLNEEVEKQRILFNRIFTRIYSESYAHVDNFVFSGLFASFKEYERKKRIEEGADEDEEIQYKFPSFTVKIAFHVEEEKPTDEQIKNMASWAKDEIIDKKFVAKMIKETYDMKKTIDV